MGLRLLVSDGFQVLFHSPPGVLFTFPSRYWFTIGGQEYLALEGGPPGFSQGFTCPGILGWQSPSRRSVPYGAFTLSGAAFQRASDETTVSDWVSALPRALAAPTTPLSQRRQAWHERGLGCSAFARRYLRNLG
jgi:hypothetical protein